MELMIRGIERSLVRRGVAVAHGVVGCVMA